MDHQLDGSINAGAAAATNVGTVLLLTTLEIDKEDAADRYFYHRVRTCRVATMRYVQRSKSTELGPRHNLASMLLLLIKEISR